MVEEIGFKYEPFSAVQLRSNVSPVFRISCGGAAIAP